MAVAVLVELPGGTAEIYEAVAKDLNLGDRLPEGSSIHVAGPFEGGWRVFTVWESREKFEAFARDKISPLTRKHGAPSPPNIQIWEVHKQIS